MVPQSTNILDHIIHLTPPGSLEETSGDFRGLGFAVIPGGTHADGLTENALVVFADGVYLELISFTHHVSYYPPGSPQREQREAHQWASKQNGWVDYAFLGSGSKTDSISKIINDRAKGGGRTRPDGKTLEWIISAPEGENRGMLPFFCGDVTPRNWRVENDHANSTPSNGISHIRILAPPEQFSTISRQITFAVGAPPNSVTPIFCSWMLDTPRRGANSSLLVLSQPSNAEEIDFLGSVGVGVYEVGFRLSKGEQSGGRAGYTPHGKITWVPEEAAGHT
ncbi:glyoxalase-like domain-containing protein [Infundibulicybe gibba]|nr:glyoxalase-like domain-containing protein [Infundibulicybe gibba]